ncbi:uncharacterized protein LOC132922383 [Rhopalosiphum padi]|uniref:uncharacterized protein LOC132922383 n=1 Tax=Rhopalosiphum padi TaxID=40932 RepID=UPI00298ECD18|nr:uncharacterized protein LOC132922383 [Rhopalosiphum padi]
MEPDGVLRRVLYTADPKNGFRASVRYVRPDGEESSNRDHGFLSGGPDRSPGPPPHQQQQQQQQSEYESDGGGDDDEPRPFSLQSQSLNLPSEYESEADEESFAPPLPRPQPLSLNFGFDKYNDVNHNSNVGDDDDSDDYGGGGGGGGGRPSAFKFPSPSSSFFKASDAVNDSGDYGESDNKFNNYHWPGTLGSVQAPSSPSPFGLPSSPSPSFGGPVAASPTTPFVGFAKRTEPLPCRPQPLPSRSPLSSDIVSYQTGHSNSLPLFVKSSDDHDLEQLRSLDEKIGSADDDDDDHDDIENYESDDSDTDTARVAADIVRLSPSAKSAPSVLPSDQTSTSRPHSLTASASATARPPAVVVPPPSFRLPPTSIDVLAIDLSPSPTMTPIQPTIIDIDV